MSVFNRSLMQCRPIGFIWCGLALCVLVGCSASPSTKQQKVEMAKLPPPKTTGSLWQEENGRAYLYEDLRAMRIGDIITILIVEKHKGSKSADTNAERDSTISNGIGGTGMGYLGIPGIRLGGEAKRGVGIDGSAKSKFGGKGATNREDTLTGTISAIVTEVLPVSYTHLGAGGAGTDAGGRDHSGVGAADDISSCAWYQDLRAIGD